MFDARSNAEIDRKPVSHLKSGLFLANHFLSSLKTSSTDGPSSRKPRKQKEVLAVLSELYLHSARCHNTASVLQAFLTRGTDPRIWGMPHGCCLHEFHIQCISNSDPSVTLTLENRQSLLNYPTRPKNRCPAYRRAECWYPVGNILEDADTILNISRWVDIQFLYCVLRSR